MAHCPYCGTEIEDTAKFCFCCGGKIADAEQLEQTLQEASAAAEEALREADASLTEEMPETEEIIETAAPAAEEVSPEEEIIETPAPAAEEVSPEEITETPAPAAEEVSPEEITETPAPAAGEVSPEEITETPAPAAGEVSPEEKIDEALVPAGPEEVIPETEITEEVIPPYVSGNGGPARAPSARDKKVAMAIVAVLAALLLIFKGPGIFGKKIKVSDKGYSDFSQLISDYITVMTAGDHDQAIKIYAPEVVAYYKEGYSDDSEDLIFVADDAYQDGIYENVESWEIGDYLEWDVDDYYADVFADLGIKAKKGIDVQVNYSFKDGSASDYYVFEMIYEKNAWYLISVYY